MKGKDRTKKGPTPKQDKWKDSFFARSQMFKKRKSWLKVDWTFELNKRRWRGE